MEFPSQMRIVFETSTCDPSLMYNLLIKQNPIQLTKFLNSEKERSVHWT